MEERVRNGWKGQTCYKISIDRIRRPGPYPHLPGTQCCIQENTWKHSVDSHSKLRTTWRKSTHFLSQSILLQLQKAQTIMKDLTFPYTFQSSELLFPSIFPKQRACRPDGCADKVVDNDSELRLSIDLPGVKPSDLSVTVNNNVLRVEGSCRHIASDGSTFKKTRIDRTFAAEEFVEFK